MSSNHCKNLSASYSIFLVYKEKAKNWVRLFAPLLPS